MKVCIRKEGRSSQAKTLAHAEPQSTFRARFLLQGPCGRRPWLHLR